MRTEFLCVLLVAAFVASTIDFVAAETNKTGHLRTNRDEMMVDTHVRARNEERGIETLVLRMKEESRFTRNNHMDSAAMSRVQNASGDMKTRMTREKLEKHFPAALMAFLFLLTLAVGAITREMKA